jgi:hypothetical protein
MYGLVILEILKEEEKAKLSAYTSLGGMEGLNPYPLLDFWPSPCMV